jgi:hypothetical protein
MCNRAETTRWTRMFFGHLIAICILTSAQAVKAQSDAPSQRLRRDIGRPIRAATVFTALTVDTNSRETLTMLPIDVDSQKTHHTGRNIAVGALVGGVLLGGVELNHARHCVDCYFTGTAVIAAFGVGAAGGAFIGWIASHL